MKSKSTSVRTVSETRFAHFVRSAPPAERQRVFASAMKKATQEQRRVIDESIGPKKPALAV